MESVRLDAWKGWLLFGFVFAFTWVGSNVWFEVRLRAEASASEIRA